MEIDFISTSGSAMYVIFNQLIQTRLLNLNYLIAKIFIHLF